MQADRILLAEVGTTECDSRPTPEPNRVSGVYRNRDCDASIRVLLQWKSVTKSSDTHM